MGCDAHVCAEVKIGGAWVSYAVNISMPRSYALFERMAGVRGGVSNAIAAPRGIPNDTAWMTQFACEHFGEDGHSHSWLSHAEIQEFYKWAEVNAAWFDFDRDCTYFFGNSWGDPRKCWPSGIEDVRWVFWFDN